MFLLVRVFRVANFLLVQTSQFLACLGRFCFFTQRDFDTVNRETLEVLSVAVSRPPRPRLPYATASHCYAACGAFCVTVHRRRRGQGLLLFLHRHCCAPFCVLVCRFPHDRLCGKPNPKQRYQKTKIEMPQFLLFSSTRGIIKGCHMLGTHIISIVP